MFNTIINVKNKIKDNKKIRVVTVTFVYMETQYLVKLSNKKLAK